jgi:predicted membrane protein
MKLSDFTKSFSPLEITTLVIFAIYIIFPFRTPGFMANVINTPLGLFAVLLITLYLFFYTNPILGVVYIFVAYELLRRSALVKSRGGDAYMVKHTPSEDKRQEEMVKLNPVRHVTLEEDVIKTMAPAQTFNKGMDISTDFKPVAERVSGASLYK